MKEWGAEDVEVGVQRPCGHERGKMNECSLNSSNGKKDKENLGLL